MSRNDAEVARLQKALFDEIWKVAGLSSDSKFIKFLAWILGRLSRRQFWRLTEFDRRVRENGFADASEFLMNGFLRNPQIRNSASLPAQGPLILASNHPGVYDLLLIGSSLP